MPSLPIDRCWMYLATSSVDSRCPRRTRLATHVNGVSMVSNERLARAFVAVADTLVDEFDLFEFLHNLADHAADLCGATSVGLMLADRTTRCTTWLPRLPVPGTWSCSSSNTTKGPAWTAFARPNPSSSPI